MTGTANGPLAAIMQPYFWPYVGHFQLIAAADIFVLYSRLGHRRGGWSTRNRLMIQQKPVSVGPQLSTPQKSNTLISELAVSSHSEWRRKLLAMVSHSYAKAPFFDETFPVVKNMLACDAQDLEGFNAFSLQTMAQHLGLTTRFVRTADLAVEIESEVIEIADTTMRQNLRVARICQSIGASAYINPYSGRALYCSDLLGAEGIALQFLSPDIKAVAARTGVQDAALSIIHLLMHAGRDSVADSLGCADRITGTPLAA